MPNRELAEHMNLKRKCLTICLILLTLYTVIGFFLIPFLIRYFGEKALQEHVNEVSVIEQVRFNPFTWSLRVEGLSTADVASAWSAKWQLAEVDVSALTVLKLYPVLDRIVLDEPIVLDWYYGVAVLGLVAVAALGLGAWTFRERQYHL